MPTPVSTARECLTEEAARVLDDAIAVARRRSHSQTTSLHAVSALLSLPNSALKEACHRNRSFAYSPRLQFRALELSVGVSLDRLPSSKTLENDPPPPISNSLMAAIKRSQANQRRHPETFHLYQQGQNQFSLSLVKVEVKHFILSILDDPIVSRVFGEAGFRSTDIKVAILHPPTPIPRFSKSRYPPPLFLCNLPDSDVKGCGLNFNFPFAVENGDDNCRRIGEILVKKNKKNPLLIGFCAKEALKGFRESVEEGKSGVLPVEIDGLSVNCIEKEISEFVCEGGSEETMGLKFNELGEIAERSTGCGVVVDFGELGVLVNGKSSDAVNYVVARLSELVEVRGEKLWLIGSAESYEIYMKFVDRFPNIEKDWDLHMLPITAATPTNGGPYSKSSLMGSFVPFGGFFPAPSEIKNLPSSKSQSISRCDMCNEKYEQEVSDILKGGSTTLGAVQHLPNLSSWLQNDENDKCNNSGPLEARVGEVQNARIVGLQRKWSDICQRLQHPHSPQQHKPQVGSPVPPVGRFDSNANRKESNGKDYTLNESTYTDHCSSVTSNLARISPRPRQNMETPVTSGIESPSLQHKVSVEVSNIRQLEMKNPTDTCYPVCNLRLQPGLTTSSVTPSVTTDLGLGTLYASSKQEHRSPSKEVPNVSGYVSATIDGISKNASSNQIMQSSFCSGLRGQSDEKDLKYLWKVLSDTVGWQEEAICTISQTISSCRSGYGRVRGATYKGDIWLSFLGPDTVGKRRIARALAQISRGDLLSMDLDPVNCFSSQDSTFDHQNSNSYNVRSRGKTVVGYLAEKLRRKPHSVLLENIDKADLMTQNSLIRAIKTGRFPDSDGREINLNNMIFVTTLSHDSNLVTGKGTSKFSEDRVLGAKGLQMKILVQSDNGDMTRNSRPGVLLMPMEEASEQVFLNKRKLIDSGNSLEVLSRQQKVPRTCIDLNLPGDETEEGEDCGGNDSDSSSESSHVWLEDFLNQVDQKVVFKPFDFDTLAQKILKDIERSLRKTLGSDMLLEIDPEVMLQILAAAYLSNNKKAVENWIEQTLQKSFVEVQQKHHLTTGSILKLVASEGFPMEEQALNVYLPANISVN